MRAERSDTLPSNTINSSINTLPKAHQGAHQETSSCRSCTAYKACSYTCGWVEGIDVLRGFPVDVFMASLCGVGLHPYAQFRPDYMGLAE